MIVVMGASGKTGSAVAERLLEKKAKIRVIGRSAAHLERFTKRGAEAAVGDVTDTKFLTNAFHGASGVYALIPPNYQSPDPLGYYRSTGQAIANGLKGSGVNRVVFLSSLGAELPGGTGPIAGLHAVEEQLKAIPGLNLLILRPGYFMDNHFGSLGLIKSQGVNGGAMRPDVAFPQIATQDIGAVAGDALDAGDFKGVTVRELLGQRDLSPAEATRIIGGKIGKPDLKYVQFPDDGFRAGLMQAGFGKATADLFVEMSHALSEGKVRSLEGRNAKNTTPTPFESFADAFAGAYRAG